MSDGTTSEDDGYSMWSRPFNFAGKIIRVEEGWGVGIGGTVWEGGVLLAQYLSSSAFDKEHSQGGRCIELGAGATGLPGIVAAQLGCFSQVVITDVDECLEALHENVAANLSPHCTLAPSCLSQAPATEASSLQLGSLPEAEAASASASASHNTSASSMSMYSVNRDCSAGEPAKNLHEASTADASRCNPQLRDPQNASQQEALPQAARHPVSKTSRTELNKQSAEQQTEVLVAELDWGQEASSVAPPFDVVLIADVVYVPEAMRPLLECIHAVSTPASLILLAKYKRFAPATEQFWKLLPEYFDCQKIPESEYGAKSQEDSIGIFRLTRRSHSTPS